MFDLLLYIQVKRFGHFGPLAVDWNEKKCNISIKLVFAITCKSAPWDFRLCVAMHLTMNSLIFYNGIIVKFVDFYYRLLVVNEVFGCVTLISVVLYMYNCARV